MSGIIDLHCHTTASDGKLTARELLRHAKKAGIATIGITDHDHVGAIDEAMEAGRALGVDVVPGVELSADLNGADVHILGYFINHHDPSLREHLAFLRAQRLQRAERIVKKLNALQVPLRLEAVLEQAGGGSVGRPHIASALVDEGLAESYQEAFLRYIGNGKPAYEQKYRVSPRQVFETIAAAGGLAFIAHPGTTLDEQSLLALLHDGVDGIEVIHPSHSPERVAFYRAIVDRHSLLASGGSDFHGGNKNDADALGRFGITADNLAMIRSRLGRNRLRTR